MLNNRTQQNGNSAQASVANAYLRTRVMSASPEELRMMLLDGAIKFLAQGREALRKKQFEAAFNGLSASREIVFELLTTIRDDVNPELASNARALYAFIYRSMVEGSFEKDDAKLESVAKLLEYERETWDMLMQKLAEERGQRTPGEPTAMVVSVRG